MLVLEGHSIISDALVLALESSGIPEAIAVRPADVDPESVPAVATGFDVVLAGLLLGDGRTTLALIQSLVASGQKVLAFTTDQGAALTGQALRAGVEAVMHKDMALERLVEAIKAVHTGRQLITDLEREALLEQLPCDEALNPLLRPFLALSPREAETLSYLVDGHAPKAVARAQGVSIHTVRKHIRSILFKLDVQSQREALALARHAGWPPEGEHRTL